MTAQHDGSRAVLGDGWRRIQRELVELLAPTGWPLPPIEADERVLWVRVDHRRGVLRIHPRTTNLDDVGLHCTLAQALVELALGPNPATTRGYRTLLGFTSTGAVLLAVTAAAGATPHALTTIACVVAVLCLLSGVVAHRTYQRRVDALLRRAYRPPNPGPIRSKAIAYTRKEHQTP